MDLTLALRPRPALVVRARGTREIAIVRGPAAIERVESVAPAVVVIDQLVADVYAPMVEVAPLAEPSVRVGRALRAYAEPVATGTLLAVA